MNYLETMDYITSMQKFGSNYGLARTEKILELLGDPHKKLKCVHIAGTNGKGSTTALVNRILLLAGYRVGMYTSPFLQYFEERIQINSELIPKDKLSAVVTKVKVAVEKVMELGYDQPTEFEIITCGAFLYFYEEKVDYAVIEVGLGGNLDSTNVIHPILSIITSISLDHMQILGNTIEQIATEKAGIIKDSVPLVLYPQAKSVEKIMEDKCSLLNSELIKVYESNVELISVNKDNFTQFIRVETYKNTYEVQLALLGEHQLTNCSVALNAVEVLRDKGLIISDKAIHEALKSVVWIGRLEVMSEKPLLVIDGAHNIDAMEKLKGNITKYFRYNKCILILGILADKQVEDMVNVIVPMAEKVFTVTPNSERAEGAKELQRIVSRINPNCVAEDNYEDALKNAILCCNPDDLLLISGSLYMIGDMRKIIQANS